MTHKRISVVIISTAILIIGIGDNRRAESAARPNIVLIMCDDMGFSDIGCYGGVVGRSDERKSPDLFCRKI